MIQVNEKVAGVAGVTSSLIYGVVSELVKNGVMLQGTKFVPISAYRLQEEYLPFLGRVTVHKGLNNLVSLGLLKAIKRGYRATWYGLGDDIDDIFKKGK